MADICPACEARRLEIDRLKDALTEAKASAPQAKAEAKAQADSAIAALQAQIAQAQRETAAKVSAAESRAAAAEAAAQEAANKPSPWPSVADFIGHCESGQCSQHKGEWDRVKEGIITAAWQNIPAKTIEERGEALGLIPKRIRVTVP